MCDFTTLTDDEREIYRKRLLAIADDFGGVNFFLQLLEAIRERKQHPLLAKNSSFAFELGTIKWNKVIFADKLNLLIKIRENSLENLLPSVDNKEYKKVLNLLRTLKPIEFTFTPARVEDGEGFTIKVFDIIGDEKSVLNPLFDVIFFCSVEKVKKMLIYKASNAK